MQIRLSGRLVGSQRVQVEVLKGTSKQMHNPPPLIFALAGLVPCRRHMEHHERRQIKPLQRFAIGGGVAAAERHLYSALPLKLEHIFALEQVLGVKDQRAHEEHNVVLRQSEIVHHDRHLQIDVNGLDDVARLVRDGVRDVRLLLQAVPEEVHLPRRRIQLRVCGDGMGELVPEGVPLDGLHDPLARNAQHVRRVPLHQRHELARVEHHGGVGSAATVLTQA
mmetsp:Transcript_30680/g.51663  ORF Transcript_30680/g.51663 Transcript_30680/m.51663 type:complete len:222 (-) Transcript_30680:710-1375(-)